MSDQSTEKPQTVHNTQQHVLLLTLPPYLFLSAQCLRGHCTLSINRHICSYIVLSISALLLIYDLHVISSQPYIGYGVRSR